MVMLLQATTSKMPTRSTAMARSSTGRITVHTFRKANTAILLKGAITISLTQPLESTKDFREHSKTNINPQIQDEDIVSHPFTIINIYPNRLRDSQTVRNFEVRRSTSTKCPVNVTTTLDTSNAPVDPLRKQMVSQ